MGRPHHIIRKIIVLIIGVPIVILGLILVPLPGPGLLIMFAGLFIISLEFDWAKRYVTMIRRKFKELYAAAQARADKISDKTKD